MKTPQEQIPDRRQSYPGATDRRFRVLTRDSGGGWLRAGASDSRGRREPQAAGADCASGCGADARRKDLRLPAEGRAMVTSARRSTAPAAEWRIPPVDCVGSGPAESGPIGGFS
jgi:hypothetical protein